MAKQTYKKHLNKKSKPNQTFETKSNEKVSAITYQEGITVGDLANKLNKNSGDIIKILFMLGKMVTINSSLDDENVELVCMEYGVDATKEAAKEDETLLDTEEDNPADLVDTKIFESKTWNTKNSDITKESKLLLFLEKLEHSKGMTNFLSKLYTPRTKPLSLTYKKN